MAARVVHFFAVLCKTTGSFEYGDAENNAEKLNLTTPFVWWRPRCRHRRVVCFKLPIAKLDCTTFLISTVFNGPIWLQGLGGIKQRKLIIYPST